MSELLLIINDFSINNPDFLTWTIAGLIVILGLLLQSVWIKEYVCEWQLNHLLKNIGSETMHNVTIPDGMDGDIFIEYLILTPKKILLLGVKKYQGLIFAADKIDLWTQVLGNKSYKFDNPLRQLENDTVALNSIIENSKIEGKVLFINGSEFPKGKPDNVITISDVKEWDEEQSSDIPEFLHADWKQLQKLAVNNNIDKGVLIDENNSSGLNLFSLMSMVAVLSFWLFWRLM
ncbi:MAG: NERD domain-containing protein [Gammaproteobacteria bacterium]|nr:NERD domain-containing protein [Gammaproteobacteria bacterium]MDH5660103.1 NERD domain-containing protein [Gammaproteobacteria bacterium]